MPPALIPLVGAILLPLLPKRLRGFFFLAPPALCLYLLTRLPQGSSATWEFLSYTLHPLVADRLSLLFGSIFSIIVFIGGVYGLHLKDRFQQTAALLYYAGAMGVTFAGDYLTLYAFWELMAVGSVVLIWARRTEESSRAGGRYILVHLAGGVILLAGILLQIQNSGSLSIQSFLPGSGGTAAWLILIGFALNAAVPPLHAWLPDAYPRGTVTGSVFLSALTTKTAVYVLIRCYSGWEVLLWAGVIMSLYGVIYAILANDIRLILAYHIVSQVGFMVAGIGLGTEMAINGAAAHAFCHILYKALLFMGAGTVLYQTGHSRLTDLGGLSKRLPVVLILYMVGAVSISGLPLFNGFISKSMTISAAEQAGIIPAFLLLELASVGTFLSVGLKLPYFTWYSSPKQGPSKEIEINPAPKNMILGMSLAAAACFLLGVAPGLLYRFLPYPVHYQAYTPAHVVGALQLLFFAGVVFFFLIPKLSPKPGFLIDTDCAYRMPAPLARLLFVKYVVSAFENVQIGGNRLAAALARRSRNPVAFLSGFVGRPVDKTQAFDPDRQRPPIQVAISLTLLFVVVMALWITLR
ncbi:MAG: Na(+)/H(+) antiporter subunit D [Candidatus Eisenbacteria bacterium]|uniref:Na(+)/H(+) antiporter subunit D n=1 Tax=Eiseniibacteriota bacterium TaxID=2212470 RepID=A0A948RZ12_UNCEI|nr:Na(+)/H(+) antiporter subunit D [Candidatus Eisenbacteria bacterium]MBU2690844.1 Na(+)/H(+) antiporter subunit D [Candidatus Eisenbacteria bacterium]